MTSRAERLALAALAIFLGAPAPAVAGPIGMRPLGADYDSARTVGEHGWAFEAGGWLPTFDPLPAGATADTQKVLENWQLLPAWPRVRAQYGWGGNNEVVAAVGPEVTGAYRKFFIRADAPWGGEYLQALMQFGGGYHLASRKPMAYVKLPAIYERGDWTFHVAGGGYYLFNDQPIVDGDFGMEYRPIPWLAIGGNAHLRMDAKKVTPMDGTWTLGGGVRVQPLDWACLQVEVFKDSGPPVPNTGTAEPNGISTARPGVEFPHQAIRASVTTYF
jgi:hypothetical protein